ncbi:conserved oligomeric Golgi complex subunit 2-like, partial [Aethina tumida]|uniref:conserved oligomeric Golgi complex subunit 2-like n=1 Tax=Aethina tumida TaxID=116153 RepID=UPI0021481F90
MDYQKDMSNRLEEYLTQSIIKECLVHLQTVKSIPRLYRKTNRSIPTYASPYVFEILKPILNFKDKQKNTALIKNDILTTIVMQVAKDFLFEIQNVLNSLQKTKESIRKLKNRHKTVTEDAIDMSATNKFSDEFKMKQQIRLDIEYFLHKINSLSLEYDTDLSLRLKYELDK